MKFRIYNYSFRGHFEKYHDTLEYAGLGSARCKPDSSNVFCSQHALEVILELMLRLAHKRALWRFRSGLFILSLYLTDNLASYTIKTRRRKRRRSEDNARSLAM